MLAGAILLVGQSSSEPHWPGDLCARPTELGVLGANPIVCLEVLGQSVLDRLVQRLLQDGIQLITVVMRSSFSDLVHIPSIARVRINPIPSPIDLWSAAECVVREYVDHGVELVLLTGLGAYTDLDCADLIRFHREKQQGLTTVTKDGDSLDSWLISAHEARKTQRMGLRGLVDQEDLAGRTPYALPGYVRRLNDASDLRALVTDGFLSLSPLRPKGREVKPGVWFGDAVRVHSRARIVAPAYLGCETMLRADTLVTRFSTVERGCDIRENTVIEDTSVLPNTRVGKGLNVAHTVVDGNKLFPLRQPIVVEIHDSRFLGRTLPLEAANSAGRGADSPSLAQRLLATAWY
jgi:NDP-sugar pyrophosphorylase family protein